DEVLVADVGEFTLDLGDPDRRPHPVVLDAIQNPHGADQPLGDVWRYLFGRTCARPTKTQLVADFLREQRRLPDGDLDHIPAAVRLTDLREAAVRIIGIANGEDAGVLVGHESEYRVPQKLVDA